MLFVKDSMHSVNLLMVSSASLSCWSREDMVGGDDGGEEGVDMSENVGEVLTVESKSVV